MPYIYTVVSIEGNTGSGKTTLLENLKIKYESNENVIFLKEPVDEWNKIKDENGVTMLEKFYDDQYKYSFPFQMMSYISRLKLIHDTFKTHQNIPISEYKHIIIITERSLYTDKMFAKMLYDTGKIEYINYQVYLNCFETFSEEVHVNKIIYVKSNPSTCHSRIMMRSRDGESNIPLEYLEICCKYHEDMLDTNSSECVCHNQLILDGNIDINKNDVLQEWITQIDDFIHNK